MNLTWYPKQALRTCLCLLAVVLTSSCSQEQIPSISIGTGGVGGNYRVAGHAITRIVNKNQAAHGFQLQDNTSPGSVSNIDALVAGDIQFGIAQADHQYQAFNGLGEWTEKGPQEDLRAVFSLYIESVTLIAGGDSGMSTIDDLKGRPVDIGLPGSGTRKNAIDALNAAGIDWETDIEAREELLDDRLAMLMHSELDAFFYTVGHPNTNIKFATYSVRGARFIPLVNIEDILSSNPYYSRSSIPIELYPRADNESDVETVGVRATFLTSAKVPEDVVYAVTKAVFENLESLGEYDPVLNTFGKENMLEGLTAPIHPGASKYYQEIGLQVPSMDVPETAR
jgi:TRAP transporter TAXI family solute receptor